MASSTSEGAKVSLMETQEGQDALTQAFNGLQLEYLESVVSDNAVDVMSTAFDQPPCLRVAVKATGGCRGDEDILFCRTLENPGTCLNAPLFVVPKFFKYLFRHPELGVVEFSNCYAPHVTADHTLLLADIGSHHLGQFSVELEQAATTIRDENLTLVLCWAECYTDHDRESLVYQVASNTRLTRHQVLFFGAFHGNPVSMVSLQSRATRIVNMIRSLFERLGAR